MDLESKLQLARTVGALVLVDGELTDAEVSFMSDLMSRLDLSIAEQEQVMDMLEDKPEVLSDIPALKEHGAVLLKELRAAAKADGMDSAEESLIRMVEDVLNEN